MSSQDQGPFTCNDQIGFLISCPLVLSRHVSHFLSSWSNLGEILAVSAVSRPRREVLVVRARSRPGVAVGFEGPLHGGASATRAHSAYTGTQSYMSTDVHMQGLPIQM